MNSAKLLGLVTSTALMVSLLQLPVVSIEARNLLESGRLLNASKGVLKPASGKQQAKVAVEPRKNSGNKQSQPEEENSELLLQVEGVLEPGDNTLDDNTFYDKYTFEVEAGQAIRITSESADFDTYLLLKDAAGNTLLENDDLDTETTNSQILFSFPEAGTYQVWVNAFEANEQGIYQITVNALAVGSVAARESIASFYVSQAEAFEEQAAYEVAISTYEKALEIYQETDNQAAQGDILYDMSLAVYELEQYETSIEYLEQALSVYQTLENSESIGHTLHRIGESYRELGSYEEAIVAQERALEAYRQIRNNPENYHIGSFLALNGIGNIYYDQGDKYNELIYRERALDALRQTSFRESLLIHLTSYGQTLSQLGRYEDGLAAYQEALAISQELEMPVRERTALLGIGQMQRFLGYSSEAFDTLEEALIFSEQLDSEEKISFPDYWILGEIANVYGDRGNYERSLEYHQLGIDQAVAENDIYYQIVSLSNIGSIYTDLGEYEQSLNANQRALILIQENQAQGDEFQAKFQEASVLSGIGSAHHALGQYEQSLNYYQQALEIFQSLQGTWIGIIAQGQTADVLNSIGLSYLAVEDYDAAENALQASLGISQTIIRPSSEMTALGNLGSVYDDLEEYDKALKVYQESLAISRRIGSLDGEAVYLNNLGVLSLNLEQPNKAVEYFEQSLVIREQIGDRVGKAYTFSNLGWAYESLGQPELAVFFYKQSINTFEEIRSSNAGLDTDLQSSYVDSIADHYRDLADLLLQEDRVLEAQRVLDLLKVQELDDYLDNVRGNTQTASGIEYWKPEEEILARYQELQADAISLGQELTRLNRIKEGGSITPEEDARRLQLINLRTQLAEQFNDFINSESVQTALDQLSRTELRQSLSLEALSGLRNKLAALDAVLFYPLILEDRLELVITTPDQEPIHRTVEGVGREDVNHVVQEFRQALDNPSSDATVPAQKLYQWLIEPIEAGLAAAGVETIIYSPDGALRYIPLAALYDGDLWLVERFRINNITAESLQEIDAQPQTTPDILAGAFADQSLSYPVGRNFYQGLLFAGREVEQLSETVDEIISLFDQDFDRETFFAEIDNANVLHFATHADLVPGDASESFILFGSGETLTLRDISTLSLFHIDLVVLSACETGLGGFDNNGAQILGMGYQFQTRGAKAVVASLWSVNDSSTQALMNTFYRALQQPGISKSEALRRAQVTLITGNDALLGDNPRGIVDWGDNVQDTLPEEVVSRLNHPYYWAPFILIGNGL